MVTGRAGQRGDAGDVGRGCVSGRWPKLNSRVDTNDRLEMRGGR